MLTLTCLTIWLRWEQAVSSGILTLTSLTIWLRWEQAGSSGILTLTSLTIWDRWEHAVGGGSGFAGGSGFGFAGCKPLVLDLVLLVAVDLTSLGASSYRWI